MENNIGISQQQHDIENILLVDELSDTEYYIGVSNNFSDPAKANWKIKRIWKVGNVWKFEFPNGSQEFKWIWDDRLSYSYGT